MCYNQDKHVFSFVYVCVGDCVFVCRLVMYTPDSHPPIRHVVFNPSSTPTPRQIVPSPALQQLLSRFSGLSQYRCLILLCLLDSFARLNTQFSLSHWKLQYPYLNVILIKQQIEEYCLKLMFFLTENIDAFFSSMSLQENMKL